MRVLIERLHEELVFKQSELLPGGKIRTAQQLINHVLVKNKIHRASNFTPNDAVTISPVKKIGHSVIPPRWRDAITGRLKVKAYLV